MSENETFAPTLSEAREPFEEMELDQLHSSYQAVFDEPAYAEGTETLTTDAELLKRKLGYSALLAAYEEAGEEVPARVNTLAEKAFSTPFTKTSTRRSRDNTIQAYIVKRLWGLHQAGETATITQLGDEVVQNFPESTYSKDPKGRMRVDINKFNKGLFPYGQANDMVPPPDNPFVPEPEVKESNEEDDS